MKKIIFVIVLIISSNLCFGYNYNPNYNTIFRLGVKEECWNGYRNYKIIINSQAAPFAKNISIQRYANDIPKYYPIQEDDLNQRFFIVPEKVASNFPFYDIKLGDGSGPNVSSLSNFKDEREKCTQALKKRADDAFNIYLDKEKQEKQEKQEKIEELIATIFISLLGLALLIYLIYLGKRFYPKFKSSIKKSKDAIKEHNIRKIAVDETIRSSIKKNIDKADDQDLDELQDLINKAIEKGDSEMAQTLLKILNKSKDK